MSIQAVAWVLEKAPTTKVIDHMVLVVLANHAADHGNDRHEAWPSIARIGREARVRDSETVRKALVRLEAAGLIERHVNAAPDPRIPADRRPTLYLFPMLEGWLTAPDATGTRATGTRATGQRPPTPPVNGPRRDGGQNVSEPLDEPLETPAPSAALEAVKPPDVATLILRAWWEEQNPRPAQPYVACLGVVRKMLMAGWSPEQVTWALREAPVVSTGALTFALNMAKRTKDKGGGAALQRAIDAMQGMTEVEQLEWWATVGPGRLSNG